MVSFSRGAIVASVSVWVACGGLWWQRWWKRMRLVFFICKVKEKKGKPMPGDFQEVPNLLGATMSIKSWFLLTKHLLYQEPPVPAIASDSSEDARFRARPSNSSFCYTAVGQIPAEPPLSRKGLRPGLAQLSWRQQALRRQSSTAGSIGCQCWRI